MTLPERENLMQAPLSPAAIGTDTLHPAAPRSIRCYGSIGSTMDVCREALTTLSSAELPLLVTAEEQTAGRGRRGRPWVAPAGSALLFSLALRPVALPVEQAASLVWAAGVALCEGINETTGLQARLKWPNDVLVAYAEPPTWRKVAGILLEASSDQRNVQWAIIGCGINVSACPPSEAVRYPAGQLAEAYGASIERLRLLQAVLRRLAFWTSAAGWGDDKALFARWRSLLHTLGTRVAIQTPDTTIHGQAEDVDRSGALIVRDSNGSLHTITSGDVGLVEAAA